jgi:hypothetical protein
LLVHQEISISAIAQMQLDGETLIRGILNSHVPCVVKKLNRTADTRIFSRRLFRGFTS